MKYFIFYLDIFDNFLEYFYAQNNEVNLLHRKYIITFNKNMYS